MNFVKSTNIFLNEQNPPEKKLFVAVLSQALHDAFATHVPNLEKKQAQSWLLGNSAHFREICLHAGTAPQYVLQKIKKRVDGTEGWKFELKMRTTPPRVRKRKHITGNAYYAAKRATA